MADLPGVGITPLRPKPAASAAIAARMAGLNIASRVSQKRGVVSK